MDVWEIPHTFGLDNLQRGTRPKPVAKAGQVVLRMTAASLNFRDTLVVEGGYGPRAKAPLIPVSDGVGVVVEVGEGVSRVGVGDRVCPMFFQGWIGGTARQSKLHDSLGGPVDGTLAEFRVFPAEGVARVPDHLSDVEAACLPCAALTAWSALTTYDPIGPDATVLIQGTGGVALFALQFAKARGARAIVTSSSDDKLARARLLGAGETINYRTTPDWDRRVKEMTAGEGCDHVLELGGAETLPRSVRAARTGATLSLIGVLSGATAELTLPLVVMRCLRLQGVTVGSRDEFEAMARAIEQHRIRPVVDRTFGFENVPAAFTYLKSGTHFGKVCVRIET